MLDGTEKKKEKETRYQIAQLERIMQKGITQPDKKMTTSEPLC